MFVKFMTFHPINMFIGPSSTIPTERPWSPARTEVRSQGSRGHRCCFPPPE